MIHIGSQSSEVYITNRIVKGARNWQDFSRVKRCWDASKLTLNCFLSLAHKFSIHICWHLIGSFLVKISSVKISKKNETNMCNFLVDFYYYWKKSQVVSFWMPEIFPNEIPKIRSLCVPHGTLDNFDGLELFYTLVNSSV